MPEKFDRIFKGTCKGNSVYTRERERCVRILYIITQTHTLSRIFLLVK